MPPPIHAPVNGTILERKVEKGESLTAQFASTAEGGPQGSVVALADLSDLQAELDIAQGDFARLKPRQEALSPSMHSPTANGTA